MSQSELCYRSATALAAAVARKDVSPVEVVDAVLGQIERLNPMLNAYCTITAEQARREARSAEQKVFRGEPLGPLHGVPVSVKDTVWTTGVRTTMASAIYADFVPREDAVLVARLRAAGAILLGKTTTPEFAHKGMTDSPLFGVTRNPWSTAHTCGGSSGGAAAAVAAGMGPLAVGTDEGGSIRIPASFCGIVGLKSTFGLIPRVPLGVAELLTHLGPLARTVADIALFLTVTAGRDDRDGWSITSPSIDYVAELSGPIGRLRVAWSPTPAYAVVDPEVHRLTEAAVKRLPELGWEVELEDPGFPDPAQIADAFRHPGLAAAVGEHLTTWRPRIDPSLIALIENGQRLSAVDVAKALFQRQELWARMHQFFQRYDLLITPTVSIPPFAAGAPAPTEVAGRPVSRRGWHPFTYPFNLTGNPAITLPCGWTAEGLPVGLQMVGRRLEDGLLLRAAAAFEALAPWAHMRPPVG
ncbi:MAG TPA: amidase [Candidatus Tectomicrobia bacterium]|nr:amidase [Candidatus Tectomicrobia bacterium]